MKILIIEKCGVKCPYWFDSENSANKGFCTHPDIGWKELTRGEDIPDWCPLTDVSKVTIYEVDDKKLSFDDL